MGYVEVIFKFILAIVLGGIVGWERETVNKPAGLRTYIIVCLGATLITIVSTTLTGSDPGRIAAQIVSSLGVLGGIVVFREGQHIVRGITTAVSMWFMGGVGVAVGAGKYFPAIISTLALYIILVFLKTLEGKLLGHGKGKILDIKATNRPGLIGDIGKILGAYNVDIVDIKLQITEDIADIVLQVASPDKFEPSEMLCEVQKLEGIRSLRWD
ncbi:MgtC/SapB family protein [bacterium]|nr:MgtC/SapB family protein [bacterium]